MKRPKCKWIVFQRIREAGYLQHIKRKEFSTRKEAEAFADAANYACSCFRNETHLDDFHGAIFCCALEIEDDDEEEGQKDAS